MASFALDGNDHHFDETLFSVKPHAGMQEVAAWLRQDLEYAGQPNATASACRTATRSAARRT
jgi:histidine ammonia-lyase